ncbi:hypothetical protein RKD28_007154 [Streptomyces sp. SAI-229]
MHAELDTNRYPTGVQVTGGPALRRRLTRPVPHSTSPQVRSHHGLHFREPRRPGLPEQVWELIGGFHSLPDWLPYIPETVSE